MTQKESFNCYYRSHRSFVEAAPSFESIATNGFLTEQQGQQSEQQGGTAAQREVKAEPREVSSSHHHLSQQGTLQEISS